MANAKVKQVLESIVQRFKEGNIPEGDCLFYVSDPEYPSFEMVAAQSDTHVYFWNR